MEWSTLLTFAAGAITPLVANWVNAKLKFHYEYKGKIVDQYKKEIRTYYLVRPSLAAAEDSLEYITENNFYIEINEIENKFLEEAVNKLKEISNNDIPLSVFDSYYDCLGSLQYLVTNGNDVHNEIYSQHLRDAMKEVHNETQRKLAFLIESYDSYINKAKKELI
ncbi:hypothetical protein [Terribacillus halophilus]|uniref:hypothetical protein n=1 Tax=Terribacillus halophilus TaxID=361279 RepID=UPI000984FD43|nr:hypothetical protein [Terribacillus halophilus]